MRIPFLDLAAQYAEIKDRIDDAIKAVIEQSAFSGGPFVRVFEENFASAHGAQYCVGVNSGTSALHLAMWASGIGDGDEVIVPANTFIATAEAVSLTGATPVFVDCEPDYYNVDPEGIERAITERTRALIAVHLYGQPAQMDRISDIAKRRDILVIEDCAQAHLAEYMGRHAGSFGVCGCFSFYPGKNLGAYGEGGAVVLNDEELYMRIAALRDHGSMKKYFHTYVGHNYRMDGLQAAILDVKLKCLREWTDKRRHNAALYRKYLRNIEEVILPREMPLAKHVYHLFVIRVCRRDELAEYLERSGISTGIHYPVPCHLQLAYGFLNYVKGSLPISEKFAGEVLSLPVYPELGEEAIKFACDKIADFYGSRNA